MSTQKLIELSRSCAANIYGTKAPSPRYADAVSRLLIGTAATESFFIHRRQHHFSMESDRGAWGLWQTELGSVMDGVKQLRKNKALRRRAGTWLARGDEDLTGLLAVGPRAVLRVIHGDDALAVLFARLHYFRRPEPIPMSLEDQAKYYKEHYNTHLGAGSPEKYIEDWNRLVEPLL